MARGNRIDDDENEEDGSEEDQDFDAEAEDSDTSPKKGKKRRGANLFDDAASDDNEDEVSYLHTNPQHKIAQSHRTHDTSLAAHCKACP